MSAGKLTRADWLLGLAFLVIGVGVYAPILGGFFVADDFAYLQAIETAGSPSVIFSALAGRYFRPTVVLVYYLNYLASGLSPWSYHLSVVLVHVANTWLVFLIGRRLSPHARLVPALAALIFVVFGGHTEAVTWIGGMADPLVTLFLLLGLLAFMQALESARPLPWRIGVAVAFACALLSKESAMIFPGLALAALVAGPDWPDRARIRRAVITLAPLIVVVLAYLALRKTVLGFTLVTLEGLGSSPTVFDAARGFLIRSFLPQGNLLIRIWAHGLDALVWLAVVGGFVWGLVRAERRPLTFLALALGIALAPVLPLSIGITTTDSERFIYLPSAFASLLVAFHFDALLRQRWLVVAASLAVCAWQVVALDGHNRRWQAAAAMTRSHTATFAPLVRAHVQPDQSIFLLAVPDNIDSAFVWRRGLHDALRLTAPDLAAAIERTHIVSVVNIAGAQSVVDVAATGPRTFQVQVRNGGSVAGPPQATPLIAPSALTPHGFVVEFLPPAGRALVLSFDPRETRVAGVLPPSRVSFGYIDIPQDGVVCSGPTVGLSGWALDDNGIADVRIALEADGTDARLPLGTAARGARPDVTAILPGFPDSPTPGWSYSVACADLKARTGGAAARLVVVATNRDGVTTTLGTRTVVFTN